MDSAVKVRAPAAGKVRLGVTVVWVVGVEGVVVQEGKAAEWVDLEGMEVWAVWEGKVGVEEREAVVQGWEE